MIIIYQSPDMFKPGIVLISWNFEGEKKKRNEYEIREDQFNAASTKLILKGLTIYTQELYAGRKHNFEYYQDTVISEKLYALNALDRDIPLLKEYTNLNALANRINMRIIPNLEILRPGKNSKIVHYGEKLNKLCAYVDNILNNSALQNSTNTHTTTNHA